MIATQYAPLARRTLKELPREQHLVHMALGLVGEIGEFVDAIKKNVIYGKPLDLVNLTEETGDDFWYTANLLTELGVNPEILQRSVDSGHARGIQGKAAAADSWDPARAVLTINMAVASIAASIATQPDRFLPGNSASVQVIETLGEMLGTLCGLYGLDPAQAMDLNIKKLAKRYGDKYSDVAALNRDTAAERVVLEGGDNNNVVQFPSAAQIGGAALPPVPSVALADGGVVESQPTIVGEGGLDFELPLKACDTSRPEGCESCQ